MKDWWKMKIEKLPSKSRKFIPFLRLINMSQNYYFVLHLLKKQKKNRGTIICFWNSIINLIINFQFYTTFICRNCNVSLHFQSTCNLLLLFIVLPLACTTPDEWLFLGETEKCYFHRDHTRKVLLSFSSNTRIITLTGVSYEFHTNHSSMRSYYNTGVT